VLQLVVERASALDVAIELDLSPELPLLRVDTLKMKQVLLNIVTNAIKFSHAGGKVALRARIDDKGVHLVVADQGIGMDDGEIETAITRFGQVASAWSRRHAGTGLGLPLAIGLIELHGGTLAIDSRKGQGTIVTLTLPLNRVLTPSQAKSA
jgi:signal transduction histidine kinase